MVVRTTARRPGSRTGGRGKRVVIVVDRGVAAAEAARLVAGRLADELPPRQVHVVARTPPGWQHLLGLDPTLVCVETALSYEPLVSGAWLSAGGATVDAGAVSACFGAVGLPASARWSRRGWRATLRRARAEHGAADLLLAISRRPRVLPPGTATLRVEALPAARRRPHRWG